jgi:phosphohistidine phosphatase
MRRLLLLRHAKAVPAEQALADIARPLAPRGERDALRIGERLKLQHSSPGLILASPAARALHTAQIVAAAFDYPLGAIAVEPRLYLAVPTTLMEVVAAQDTAIEDLLIVGHNPGLTEFVHELTSGFDVDDLPTGAIVALDYSTAANWAQLERADARVAYYDFPKNSRAPITTR